VNFLLHVHGLSHLKTPRLARTKKYSRKILKYLKPFEIFFSPISRIF
jgi:hypothetical protein